MARLLALAPPLLLALSGCAAPRAAPLAEPVGVTARGCDAPPVAEGPAAPVAPRGLGGFTSVLGAPGVDPPELRVGPAGVTLRLADRTFVEEDAWVYQGSVTRSRLRAPDGEQAIVTSWDTGTRLCGEVRVAERAPLRGAWYHAE